jgi:uncharacterized coiled-coil DUF342 family protein
MTSIFLDKELNTLIKNLKVSLNLMTPESINAIQNINTLNEVHRELIKRKKEINDLRQRNDIIPSDITYIEIYSDEIGDKIILVENRIQEVENETAGGKRRRNNSHKRRGKYCRRGTKRRRNKSHKRKR